jgi:hypothetical protein
MGSTWKKAVLMLASCGALGACQGGVDDEIARTATQPVPHVAADSGKYELPAIVQPPDRVIDL